MLKEQQIFRLKLLEMQASKKLGKLPAQLTEQTPCKEKVLAEMGFQRDIIDTCQICMI